MGGRIVTQFDKRNISMMMDLYEMTMANGCFANQQKTQKVVFDVFYRKNPDQGGYAVFAGLEQVVEYAENLHFDSADIDYFRLSESVFRRISAIFEKSSDLQEIFMLSRRNGYVPQRAGHYGRCASD